MSENPQKKRVPGKSEAPAPKGRDKETAGNPRKAKPNDSEDIERAVYDGMQDLRANKPG